MAKKRVNTVCVDLGMYNEIYDLMEEGYIICPSEFVRQSINEFVMHLIETNPTPRQYNIKGLHK